MKRNGIVAFDCDGTYCQKEVREGRKIRSKEIPPDIPLLIQLLERGFVVAVCSGNSAKHIIRVLMRPLFSTMYQQGKLQLAENVYAFFQLGGGLARFSRDNLAKIQKAKNWQAAEQLLFGAKGDGFATDHLDVDYVKRQSIDLAKHGAMLEDLMDAATSKYKQLFDAEKSRYKRSCHRRSDFENPEPELRRIQLDGNDNERVVQYTLRPLLSEKHYTAASNRGLKYEDSIRYKIAEYMNGRLEQQGAGLSATAAGEASVDITNHDLSKKTALEHLRGLLHEHSENILYFGDELHSGGNDVVVPLDLKITSFSVGHEAIFHPYVFAAPEPGPRGTFSVLHSLLGFSSTHQGNNSVVDAYREEHARQIILRKLDQLSADTLQSMALVATAGARDQNMRDIHKLVAEQVRSRHENQRPPGASHWTDSS